MKKLLNQLIYPALSGLIVALLVMLLAPKWLGLPHLSFNDVLSKGEQLLGIGEVSYSSAVKEAAPAVVNIATATLINESSRSRMPKSPFTENNLGRAKVETSLGSGVIISPDGYLLTNNHVIEGADRIVAVLKDGREESATIVGRDPETDLAVLKIDLNDLPSLDLADSGQTEVGDVVLAIGNPFGLGQTVTMGIISATGRNDLSLNTYEDFIQTDAAINVGNSGGALINARGELVGINTLLFSRGGGNEGVGFAIPSSMARFVTQSIIKYGRVVRGWLGIESQPLTSRLAQAYGVESNVGILISGVYDNGPADLAGLRRGDILTAINNISTNDGRKVMNMVAQEPPGSEVTLQILRNNQPFEMKAVVATRPNMVN
ncbi:S1C family serine protease [Endozoicomonas sp. 8E]|uniref:S1C family serine protease n=1 Tax=Endozoicomonas sp. 8E TaxID=3035692 RepID=UPI002938EC47|nr:trypsin-like peptidase domain-containing protein [Endozoicomonas sp. 8E]WOG29191.1 trypsin-like peptidase domain-containing protein [Endozoicomonas sp. 8E]